MEEEMGLETEGVQGTLLSLILVPAEADMERLVVMEMMVLVVQRTETILHRSR